VNALSAACLAFLLTQTATEPAPPTQAAPAEPPAESTAESTADSARRAADAAERAAEAAQRSAAAVEALLRQAAPAAPPAAPPSAAAGERPSAAAWAGTAGVSLISITGNAQTLTLSGTGAASRRSENWVWSARAAGAYGQSRVTVEDAPAVVALNAAGQIRGDRRFTQLIAAYAMVGAETDHVKSIEYRTLTEAGTAVTWVEWKEGDLVRLVVRTDLALRYSYESRFQYYPTPMGLQNVTLVAPKLGLGFRYALGPGVAIVEEAEILTNIVGPARVLVTSLTRLNARLSEALALSVGFQVNHDSAPAEGRVPTDTALSVGLELAF
jgi:hypothetical protein